MFRLHAAIFRWLFPLYTVLLHGMLNVNLVQQDATIQDILSLCSSLKDKCHAHAEPKAKLYSCIFQFLRLRQLARRWKVLD
jgi:hypothetical protein